MKTLLSLCILIGPVFGGTIEQRWLLTMEEGGSLRDAGQYAQAVERYSEALRIAGQFDPDGRAPLLSATAMAAAYIENGQLFNAEKAYQRSLSIARANYGSQSFEYAVTLGNLATLYVEQRLTAQAEPALRESLRLLLALKQPAGYTIVRQQIALGQLLTVQNKYEEAAAQLEPAIHSTDADLRLTALNALGVVRLKEHRATEAARLFETALEIARAQQSASAEIRLLTNLGEAYVESRQMKAAGDAYRRAVDLDDARGVDDQARGTMLKRYAGFLKQSGQCAASRSYHQKSKQVLEAATWSSAVTAQVDQSTLVKSVARK